MLKNKIYKYLFTEIFKNFATILLTFTAIAWAVRAVNFLDLMIEDGYPTIIYFQYSILNISTIITRFVPLSFLLSLIISIVKFEREQELMILWTVGLNKIKIVNFFFLIGFVAAIFQVMLAVIINPFSLSKSRALLRETSVKQISSILKTNDFSDAFKGVTFYIGEKNPNNELTDIFIKDKNGSLDTIISEAKSSKNTTIFAKKGFVTQNKLILFNGTIQTLNENSKLKNFKFDKTELVTDNFTTRTIKQIKIQETSTHNLYQCLRSYNSRKFSPDCRFINNKKIVVETLSRRIGMPLYIPLISVIASFLLIYRKEKKYNHLKKYIFFGLAFIILIFSEILLRFTGFSSINFVLYFCSPLFLSIILYIILAKKMTSERMT